MKIYYNEVDKFAADWIYNLIKNGSLPKGDIDTRSIEDVLPSEIIDYDQCHFFAGIGVWAYATKNRKCWTGSCPCQPFSKTGKKFGFADERHLWPAWFHLISQCKPEVIFGEQVASQDGLSWLDLVSADLEGEEYAIGAFDICAAGFGSPQIRQRLYFVAEWLSNPERRGSQGGAEQQHKQTTELSSKNSGPSLSSNTNGFWSEADWLYYRDGRFRPIEPGTFPLDYGPTQRVGRLRAYGNSIVAPQAKEFVDAYYSS
jgi:DNA (cytosine-5)-methyltransferase 1